MKRLSLRFQVFLSIISVSLMTALIVGLFARTSLSMAFDAFLGTLYHPMGPGRGRGRAMLGAAEQTFLAHVDRGVYTAALIAVLIGVVVAILLAAYLARPLRRLEDAAEVFASGDLSHRVQVSGSHEVAALSEAFNTMADSLEQAEALRRRLVADVAHELRNPLAAARAQAEGIVDGIIEPDTRRFESLLEDLEHLSVLIDDLQELAIADAGALLYEMIDVDVAALVAGEADRSSGLISPNVELVVDAGTRPVLVEGDERRLAQVIRNLLTNAARHTQTGAVTVAVETDGDEAVVSVSDTGEGISPDDLEHIFERFYRADTARAAATGGSGLGLAISRAIVEDHHGRMFANSTPGEGTTIGFRLPLHPTT